MLDFALTSSSGLSGAAVTGVTGSGATRTVTVSSGSGAGTLRLDLKDNDSIKDAVGNPLGGAGLLNGDFSTGQAYTIDRTPPQVLSIKRASANPPTSKFMTFTVTFSEAVTGVGQADFSVTSTGYAPGIAVTSVTGTGATRTVTVYAPWGWGTLRLDLIDDNSIKDALWNPLGGAGLLNGDFKTGEAYSAP